MDDNLQTRVDSLAAEGRELAALHREIDRQSELHIGDLAESMWLHRWFLIGAGLCLAALCGVLMLAKDVTP